MEEMIEDIKSENSIYEAVLSLKDSSNKCWIDFDIYSDPNNESIVTGYIKWDGCMDMSGSQHVCSIHDLNELHKFIVQVYNKAFDMMNLEVPS